MRGSEGRDHGAEGQQFLCHSRPIARNRTRRCANQRMTSSMIGGNGVLALPGCHCQSNLSCANSVVTRMLSHPAHDRQPNIPQDRARVNTDPPTGTMVLVCAVQLVAARRRFRARRGAFLYLFTIAAGQGMRSTDFPPEKAGRRACACGGGCRRASEASHSRMLARRSSTAGSARPARPTNDRHRAIGGRAADRAITRLCRSIRSSRLRSGAAIRRSRTCGRRPQSPGSRSRARARAGGDFHRRRSTPRIRGP